MLQLISCSLLIGQEKSIFKLKKQDSSKLICSINLYSLSFVKKQADNKYFKNRFQIIGKNEIIQFQCENNPSKLKMIKVFEKLLNELREFEKIREEKCINQILRYIVYQQLEIKLIKSGLLKQLFKEQKKEHLKLLKNILFTQLKQDSIRSQQKFVSLNISIKVFVRYSEVVKLRDKFRKIYGNAYKIPDFPENQWLQNHKTIIIEQRQQSIEKFLQIALQTDMIDRQTNKKGNFNILASLNLPSDFYELPTKIDYLEYLQANQRFSFKQSLNQSAVSLRQSSHVEFNIDSGGETFQAYYKEVLSEKVNLANVIESEVSLENQQLPNSIQVQLLDGTSMRFFFDNNARVNQVVELVAKQLKMDFFLDFRLFFVDELLNYRVLDNDEVLLKIWKESQNKNTGVFKSILNFVEKKLSMQESQFVFRKYIYFPWRFEELDFKNDKQRLRLLAYEVFALIKSQTFQYQFYDYCLFGALYFILKENVNLSLENIDIKKLTDIIPLQIFHIENEKNWKKTVQVLITKLDKQVKNILEVNLNAKLRNNDDQIITNYETLIYMAIINITRENKLCGVSLFYVETHQKTMQWMINQGLKIFPNIQLGVSFKKLHLLLPDQKEIYKSYPIKDISGIKSFPSQIIFELENFTQELKFNTPHSYEIKKLIEEYQSIQRFMLDHNIII